jgi:hypothetical protein
MLKLDAEKAAKLAYVLFRYMRARHRFKGELVERPLSAHELAELIRRGKYDFDEVYIDPAVNPPITFDGKADDVIEALINKKYRAIPFWDPMLVAAWRHYVIGDGPLPQWPSARRLGAARAVGSRARAVSV